MVVWLLLATLWGAASRPSASLAAGAHALEAQLGLAPGISASFRRFPRATEEPYVDPDSMKPSPDAPSPPPPTTQVDKVIREDEFADMLQATGGPFFGLARGLLESGQRKLVKPHYHQLLSEANDLETFLDDFGARRNRAYHLTVELVAGLRGVSRAGYHATHLLGRWESYGAQRWLDPEDQARMHNAFRQASEFCSESVHSLLTALLKEVEDRGVNLAEVPERRPAEIKVQVQRRLARDLGDAELAEERQHIAEVASRFLQAAELLSGLRLKRIEEAGERRQFLAEICSEEHARVYEATVHNLQSAYDTYIANTVIEAQDERLWSLRGHASATLHLLSAVTELVHFQERHESEDRSEQATRRLIDLVSPDDLRDTVLHHLLMPAEELLSHGRTLAEELLPSYSELRELEVELPEDISLHARPASLIVRIVNRFGMPVDLQLGSHRCNAASILELLVAVGSNPGERVFRFHGDERPLQHIALLFEHGLFEQDGPVPPELEYLDVR